MKVLFNNKNDSLTGKQTRRKSVQTLVQTTTRLDS